MNNKEISINGNEAFLKIIITATLCLILSTAISYAGGLSAARAVGMGGAQIGLAKGVYAPLYNPANLGLSGYQKTGIELAGFGAEIANNSFTLGDYNKYTGAILSDDDKSVILGKIPAEGLKMSAEAEAGAMSASFGSFALSINGHAATETNLGRDVLDLFFNGNSLNDTFSVEGMYSDAFAYASVGLSYGRPLMKLGSSEISIGTTVKYIKGFAYEEITEIRGGIVTLATGFSGDGSMIARTALGGSGYSIDLGGAIKFNSNYTAGITFQNLLSNITWTKDTEQHSYYFSMDTITADQFDDDSIVVTDDQSIDIPAFSASLPSLMRVGFANTSGKLIWAVDYIQGFELAAGTSSKPEIALGAEYQLLGFLPVRAGYSVGGGKGSTVSGGLGFDFSIVHLDLAVSNHSFMQFEETKGLHMAASFGLLF